MTETTPRRGPTIEPIPEPPGYFVVTKNGRIHRVERAQRITWPDGQTWIAADCWCHTIGLTTKGALVRDKPEGEECQRCLERLYGPSPRVRYVARP